MFSNLLVINVSLLLNILLIIFSQIKYTTKIQNTTHYIFNNPVNIVGGGSHITLRLSEIIWSDKEQNKEELD